jgi:putative redox protein
MSHATAIIREARYAVSVRAGSHDLISDEGQALGGQDAGPSPYELLLASLGSCTVMTMKMYAERKGWPLVSASVKLLFERDGDTAKIRRVLKLEGDLTEEQRARFADIAERTPVTLTLKAGVPIHTKLV